MDISIILTCSNPEKFAELNAIGQWLGMKDVIDLYYDDQLNQAVRAEEQRVGRYGHARVRSQTLIVRQDENKFVCGYRRISGGDRQNSVC
jgi:hypothetical protein